MPILFWLLVGHAICDYPLQGEFLAKGKNHKNPIPGYSWFIILANHALIHAGMVGLITGSFLLAMVEFVLHFFTDFFKNQGWYGFKTDQLLHSLTKILYVVLIFYNIT